MQCLGRPLRVFSIGQELIPGIASDGGAVDIGADVASGGVDRHARHWTPGTGADGPDNPLNIAVTKRMDLVSHNKLPRSHGYSGCLPTIA